MSIYDVVVVGGGASGLIAAGRASELGARVLLLEKNKQLGVKLLMTGGGRCNFTNQSSPRVLAEAFGQNGKFLLSGLNRFGSEELIDFFSVRGLKYKIEDRGRVFPEGNKAQEILKLLVDYIKDGHGEIKTDSKVTKIIKTGNKISKLILADGSEIIAKKFIIATGGKSYPLSGSSGEAYSWLAELGHKIIKPRAALSPIIISENIKDLEGLSLSGAELTLVHNGQKIGHSFGDFIFTSRSLSGPAVLSLSRDSVRASVNKAEVVIDFCPDLSAEDLEDKIIALVAENKQVDIKNILARIFPKRLSNFILLNNRINPDKKANGLTKIERQLLVMAFKKYSLTTFGVGDFTEAMITLGGVDLKEVDPKTMASKLYSNLYLAGEVLDLDGPTGGYNLQAAWTTGYLAGEAAASD
ncbi:MAG: NAD(P)/FAD-dependent oxidoreductase [Candidatus Falkowbacteria bacterium]